MACHMMTSTSGYPSTLDGGKHLVTKATSICHGISTISPSTPWAEQPQTINEVGSIYTVQGFDLNYIGIIIGPPFYLTDDNRLKVDPSKVTDVEIFKHRSDMTPEDYEASKVELEKFAKRVIASGIKGMYLHAHDPKLKSYLERMNG